MDIYQKIHTKCEIMASTREEKLKMELVVLSKETDGFLQDLSLDNKKYIYNTLILGTSNIKCWGKTNLSALSFL